MTSFARDWSAAYEAIPADTDDASEGASRIRENRVDTRERFDVDHFLPGTAPADKSEEGEHRKVTFYTQIADPTAVADKGFLYIKDVSAKAELFWRNEDGNVIQLTDLAALGPILAAANTWSGLNTHTGDIRFSASQSQWAKGADIVSAAALPVLDDGNYFDVTGTTAITSIDTQAVGTVVRFHFDDALVLTHNATTLILPGGANITTAAGDEFTFVEYATGNWRCVAYALANGKAIVETAVTLPAPDFTSSEQTVTASTVLDIAHGLAVVPDIVQVVLRCKTTQHGYAVGDEILIGSLNASGNSAVTCNIDTTNVTIVQGATIDLISITTLLGVSITVGNFKWVVRAWKQ